MRSRFFKAKWKNYGSAAPLMRLWSRLQGGEASILVDQAVTYYFLNRKEDMTRELQVLPDTVIGRGDVLRVERVFPEPTKQTDSLSRVDALK